MSYGPGNTVYKALPIVYKKTPFKLQSEDGFIKAETCSCCVLLINYILCNEVVLDYKFIYFIKYILLTQLSCICESHPLQAPELEHLMSCFFKDHLRIKYFSHIIVAVNTVNLYCLHNNCVGHLMLQFSSEIMYWTNCVTATYLVFVTERGFEYLLKKIIFFFACNVM